MSTELHICGECGAKLRTYHGLTSHRGRVHPEIIYERTRKSPAVTRAGYDPIGWEVLRANEQDIAARIAQIAERAKSPRPPSSARTALAADLTPQQRAERQHHGAPKVGK